MKQLCALVIVLALVIGADSRAASVNATNIPVITFPSNSFYALVWPNDGSTNVYRIPAVNISADKQTGTFLLSNFLAMGISNIVCNGCTLTTNSGVLTISVAGSGGGTNYDYRATNTAYVNEFVRVAKPTYLIWGGNSRNIQGGSETPWATVFTNHFFPSAFIARMTNEAVSGTPLETETNRFMTNIRAQWAPFAGTNAWYFCGDPIVNVALGSNTTTTIMTYSNLFRMAIESNFVPVAFTGFDYGVNGASLTVAQRIDLGKINSWLLTNGVRGVRVVDVARAFASRTATGDGVHMNNWAMTNLAELVWQAMNTKQTAEPRTYSQKFTEVEVVGEAGIAFGGFLAPMQIQSDYPGIAYEATGGARYVPTIYSSEWTLFGNSAGGTVTGNQIYGMNESRQWFKGPIRNGSDTGPGWFKGTGTPEGAVSAPVGSIYSRTDGGAGTSMYVKESGSGNTGWVGK